MRSLYAAAVMTLALGALPVLAQQPTDQARPNPAPPAQARPAQAEPQAMLAQGELVRVDTTAKTIIIKTATEPQMRFSYSDTTKVVGAGESVAGLATLSGSEVAVKYTKRGEENVATEINVQKPKA